MKHFKLALLFCSLCLISQIAIADTQSPTSMLRTVSNQAIAELKAAKAKLPKYKSVPILTMHRIIDQKLLPHVNLDTMARAVLGRHAWRSASGSQQKRFKQEFTDLVINTYASALRTFDKNEVKFYRIRGGYKNKSIVQVNSIVVSPGAPTLPVVYHLEKEGSKWLIFDLSVDGISLIESYKAQFASLLQQKGMNGLIDTLAKHNKSLMAKHQSQE